MSIAGVEKLEGFCLEALGMLGLSVSEDSDGVWSVAVPSSMIELFEGRTALRLTFDPECAGDDIDLVVPGSFVLERLLEAVRQRGSLGSLYLKASVRSAPMVRLENAHVRAAGSEVTSRPLVMLVYRISLMTDENEDRLYSVVADARTGEKVDIAFEKLLSLPLDPAGPKTVEIDPKPAFASGRKLAEATASEWARSIRQSIDLRLQKEFARLDAYYQDLLNDSIKGKSSKDLKRIQKHRDRALVAYDETTRMYDTARELLVNARTWYALQTLIDRRLDNIKKEKFQMTARNFFTSNSDTEQMAKLDRKIKAVEKASKIAEELIHMSLNDALIKLEEKKQKALEETRQKSELQEAAKFDEGAMARLETMSTQFESEKEQRKAELRDKFSLKITITPVNASVFHYPVMRCFFEASNSIAKAAFEGRVDMVTGDVDLPVCGVCGSEKVTHLCSDAHLVCSNCLRTCSVCGRELCKNHIRMCPLCLSEVCTDDLRTCAECGKLGCVHDISDCPACGKGVCPEHGVTCRLCGQRFCRGCLRSSGYCPTCGGLFPATSSATIIPDIIEELSGKAPANGGRWYLSENDRQFVFAQSGFRMRLYVVDKAGRQLVLSRRLGLFSSMRQRFRLSRGSVKRPGRLST